MKRSRLFKVVGLLFMLMAGLLLPGSGGTAAAASPALTFSVESIDCDSVTGTFTWSDAPVGGWVEVFLYNSDVLGLTGLSIPNLGDDTDGQMEVAIPFSTDQLDGWHIYGAISDEFDQFVFQSVDPELNRPCLYGSVGGGGTGDDEDAPAPVDARSGVTSEPGDTEPAADPDDDGRVQVP